LKTALITPSYAPDFDRCAWLVESANKYVQGLDRHCLLIDRRDEALFLPLAGGRVELLFKEDLLPQGYKPLLGSRKWWWNGRGLPVRGWIVQQVAKLAVCEAVDAQAYVYADSDVVFVRDWDVGSMWQGQSVRLFREQRRGVMLSDARYKTWYRAATRYAGVSDPAALTGGYIAQLNVMRRDRMKELLASVSAHSHRGWRETLLGTLDFSEFILYGAFVEHACSMKGHFVDDKPLSLSSWYFDFDDSFGLDLFLQHLEPRHVAVHVQSNLKIPPSAYRQLIDSMSV
jgi:hypothetical protein